MVGRFDASRSCCDLDTESSWAGLLPLQVDDSFLDRTDPTKLWFPGGITPASQDAHIVVGNYHDPALPTSFQSRSGQCLARPTAFAEPSLSWDTVVPTELPSSKFFVSLFRSPMGVFDIQPTPLTQDRTFWIAIREIESAGMNEGFYSSAPQPGFTSDASFWGARIGPFTALAGDGLTPVLEEHLDIDISPLLDYYKANHLNYTDNESVLLSVESFGLWVIPDDDWTNSAGDNEFAAYKFYMQFANGSYADSSGRINDANFKNDSPVVYYE